MKTLKAIVIAITSLLLAPDAGALELSHYATSSRLSEGKWVKIATDAEGIYQISYAQLKELGFSEPQNVQVYGYGALQLTENKFRNSLPDDLTPTATMHTADGRILFYGEGDATVDVEAIAGKDSYSVRRNYYDTRSYYFLSDAHGLAEIPLSKYTASVGVPATSHICAELYEEDLRSPGKGGVAYYGKEYSSGEAAVYPCKIKNFAPTAQTSKGSFSYVFAFASARTVRASVSASKNINILETENLPATGFSADDYIVCNLASGHVTFSQTDARPLQDVDAEFTINIPVSEDISYCAADLCVLRYPRANKLDDDTPFIIMNYGSAEREAGSVHCFENTGEGYIIIWDIDNPQSISQFATDYNSENNNLIYSHSTATSRTVAFRPSAEFASPTVVGTVENQNLHALPTPEMLIITTSEFEPIANKLADIHRKYQGMDVAVVVHDKIYNEFSSGARDAMAYRRFAKMFYDRTPDKFKYLLLFGVGAYDNRCVEIGHADRLLSYQNTNEAQSRNSVTNYASDNYFGMLADNYTHRFIHNSPMQIAAARVPAILSSEALSYVNKVERYFQNPPSPEVFSRAILIAGEADMNIHLSHQLEVEEAMKKANPDMTFIPIPMQLYINPKATIEPTAQDNILENELKKGVGYLTFSGHGGPKYVSMYHILDTRKASQLVYDNPPFVMLSSCDQYAYDHMNAGLLETMLFAENGGAIGGVGSTRSVYISFNQFSCVPVAQAYAQSKSGDTFGDIYLNARNISLSSEGISNSAMINAMNYNLAGDPAIPLSSPQFSAVISKIGGTDFKDLTSVAPLTPTKFEGYITDLSGNRLSYFNGKASINILESAKRSSTYNTFNETEYKPVEIDLNYDVLAHFEANVVNGGFSVDVALPVPTVAGGSHTLIVSATDDASGDMALSKEQAITIADYNPTMFENTEFAAPRIVQFYIDSPDFVPGSEHSSTITVSAIVDPSATGLRLSSNDISTRTRLTIDGIQPHSNLEPMFTTLDDGTLQLTARINGLAEGSHSLELLVANNAGLTDRASLDFAVITRTIDATITLSAPLARTSAVIDASGDISASNRLIIEDAGGKTVFSAADVAFPYEWNLNDIHGNPVPDGKYKISLLLRQGNFYGHSSNPAELIVIR